MSVKVPVNATGVPTAYTAPLGGPVMVATGSELLTVTVKLQVEPSLAVHHFDARLSAPSYG